MMEPDSNVTPCKQYDKDCNPHEWSLPIPPAFAKFLLVLQPSHITTILSLVVT